MITHTLSIEHQQFEQVGFAPRFDGAKFDELLNELVPKPGQDVVNPTVRLAPDPALLEPSRLRYMLRVAHPHNWNTGVTQGEYDDRTWTLHVLMDADGVDNNGVLLHETSHWADQANGVVPLKETQPDTRGKRVALVAGAQALSWAIGGAVYVATHEPLASITAAAVAVSITTPVAFSIIRRHYYLDDHAEEAARAFAVNPDILERYGDILSVEGDFHPRHWAAKKKE